jgi:hypothetical protein
MKGIGTAALVITACLLGPAAALAPDTLWVKRLDLGSDEAGYSIARQGGAMVVAGSAWTGSSNDILLARLNPDGDTVWTRVCDGGFDDAGMSVCLDAELNACVTGYAVSYKDAGSSVRRGRDVFGRSRPTFAEDFEQFGITARYDSLGERKWLRVDTNHITFGAAAGPAGDIYLSGAVNNGGGYDLWFARLDSAGDTVWTRTYDLAPMEMGYRMALGRDGSIAACAYAGDFDDFDCFALRLTADGDTFWTRRFNQRPDDGCSAVAVDPDGNIIVVGRCADTLASDGLVLKYNRAGALLWQRVVDFNTDDGFTGVACDSAGNVYVTGYTGFNYPHDCLTMKFDPTGTVLWDAIYGGAGEDQAGDVVCDPDGNPIVVGYVSDSLTYALDLLTMKYGALTGVAESPVRARPDAERGTIVAAPDFVLSVPGTGRYRVELCDLSGRTARVLHNGSLSAGAHRFSVAGLPAGSYFARVSAPQGGVSCRRLLLVK